MQKKEELPNFLEVQVALDELNIQAHPSEIQASLVALMFGKACVSERAWLEAMMSAFINMQEPSVRHSADTLHTLFRFTHTQVMAQEFEFTLLLPEDTAPLQERLSALVLWVQSFLSGLKVLGVDEHSPKTKELSEQYDQLIQIACLKDTLNEADSESDERHFFELMEYVPQVVLMFHQMRDQLFQDRAACDKKSGH